MNKFTKIGLAATALVLGSAVQTIAAPVITMNIFTATGAGDDAARAAECTAGAAGATYTAGGSCSASTLGGVSQFVGNYGVFTPIIVLGAGNGDGSNPLEKLQPALWLNNTSFATSQVGSMEVELIASGYNLPASPFTLLSGAAGTIDAGMEMSAQLWFDATDSGVAGIGVQLMDVAFTPGSVVVEAFNVSNTISFAGTYGLSWILNVSRTFDSGQSGTANFAGTNAAPLPGPAALGIFGLGLIGIAMVRRRKTA